MGKSPEVREMGADASSDRRWAGSSERPISEPRFVSGRIKTAKPEA